MANIEKKFSKLKVLILTQKCRPKIIVLDNSERMPDLIKNFAQETNYNLIEFKGMGPINTYSWSTTLLIQDSIT